MLDLDRVKDYVVGTAGALSALAIVYSMLDRAVAELNPIWLFVNVEYPLAMWLARVVYLAQHVFGAG